MKTVFSILLTVLYIFAAQGVVVNTHFCGGELRDVAVNEVVESCCDHDSSGVSFTTDCCDFNTVNILIDQEVNIPNAVLTPRVTVAVIATLFNFQLTVADTIEIPEQELYSPPPLQIEPLWLSYHQFTFYG